MLSFSERKLLCTVYAAKDQILSFYTSIPLEYVDIDMSVCVHNDGFHEVQSQYFTRGITPDWIVAFQ